MAARFQSNGRGYITCDTNLLKIALISWHNAFKQAQTVLAKVHKVIADGHTDKSLDEILMLTLDEYTEGLRCPIREMLCYSSINPVNAWSTWPIVA